MNWLFFLIFLIIFELIADVLVKEWSLNGSILVALGAFLVYALSTTLWLLAMKLGAGLARGVIIFSVVSAILAAIIGLIFYKESLTKIQLVGIFLGVISLTLIFWNSEN